MNNTLVATQPRGDRFHRFNPGKLQSRHINKNSNNSLQRGKEIL